VPTRRSGPIGAVDRHVGSRIRLRRQLLGMSQTALGEALGMTFQQVQKYERGANRISAGTLYRAAQALDVPVSFLFDGLADGGPAVSVEPAVALGRGEARMLRLLRACPDPVVAAVSGVFGAIVGEAEDGDGP